MLGQLIFTIPGPLHYVDLAGEQNEGARGDLAGRDNMSSGRVGSALSKSPDPADFRRVQLGKHLVASRFDQLEDSGMSHGDASGRSDSHLRACHLE
jgi:hypothetical protein